MIRQKITGTLLILLMAAGSVNAQELRLENHVMVIEGTSNVRDWEARIESAEADLRLEGYGTGSSTLRPEQFRHLSLQMPVANIQTDTRGLTNNIHKYLKEDEQPVIRFELEQVEDTLFEDDQAILNARGQVTAAGQTISIPMEVGFRVEEDGSLLFYGSQSLKMTDFGIKPPTAVFGTIRAVDDITINYELRFSR